MAQPPFHHLHLDDTTLQPSAGLFDLDPQLQSDDVESWAGFVLDSSSGQSTVEFASHDIHNYLHHNFFAPQPAQLTELSYYNSDHPFHDTGFISSVVNDFNWSAVDDHNRVLPHDGFRDHFPVAEASYMATPAPQGYAQPLQTSPGQNTAVPAENPYSTTVAAISPLRVYGELSQVAAELDFAIPMQELNSDIFPAVNQKVTEAPPTNTNGDSDAIIGFNGSEGPLGAWTNVNAIGTDEMHYSDPLVPLFPIVSGVPIQRLQKQKSEQQFVCCICHHEAGSSEDLEWHARFSGHRIWKCHHHACDEAFSTLGAQKKHWIETHASDHDEHGLVRPRSEKVCDECNQVFTTDTGLSRHGMEQQHTPYTCKCDKKFSRIDVLERHVSKYQPGQTTYPCNYCKRHRGESGFKRKEHLTQHLRNYHHHIDHQEPRQHFYAEFPVCPHSDCPQYRGPEFCELSWSERNKAMPFKSQAEYTKHMREEHNESTFPCDVPHCHKVGGKGYFREKDLMKHREALHPDAPKYVAAKRKVLYSCHEPWCGRRGETGFVYGYHLWWHYRRCHGYRRKEADKWTASVGYSLSSK